MEQGIGGTRQNPRLTQPADAPAVKSLRVELERLQLRVLPQVWSGGSWLPVWTTGQPSDSHLSTASLLRLDVWNPSYAYIVHATPRLSSSAFAASMHVLGFDVHLTSSPSRPCCCR